MKVMVIEGSPEELAEFEQRTGLIRQGGAGGVGPGEGGGPGTVPTPSESDLEDTVRSFIGSRARTPQVRGHVEEYLRKTLGHGGVTIQRGTSQVSKDGFQDYLLIYDAGPRNFGSAATVNARNAGLTLRLTRDEVADVADRVTIRQVSPGHQYQVNCPLTSGDAVDLAVELTRRALAKIRRASAQSA